MHKLWLYSVKSYLKLGMFFYFKKVQVVHANKIPKNTAVLILSNHQNALLDALLIGTTYRSFSYFLTRASVFKNKFANKFLRSLQMLPIYRVRDGWNTITKNKAIFSTCSNLLKQNKTLLIFPEGNHNLKRTIRPLSKGFTRIVFETLQHYPDTNLKVLPVGLNFEKPTQFPDSVSVYYGDLIDTKQYTLLSNNENSARLKQDVYSEISKLTTNIPSNNYFEIKQKLEKLNVNFLRPKLVNACIASGFKNCEPNSKKRTSYLQVVFKFLLKIVLLGPYLVWYSLIKPKIKEAEFISTFRFVVAITLVPCWLILLSFIIASSYSITYGILFIAFVLLLDVLAVKT